MDHKNLIERLTTLEQLGTSLLSGVRELKQLIQQQNQPVENGPKKNRRMSKSQQSENGKQKEIEPKEVNGSIKKHSMPRVYQRTSQLILDDIGDKRNGKRKSIPESQPISKRERRSKSIHARNESSQDRAQADKNPPLSTADKNAAAMKKRGSYLRKTIAGNSAVHDEVVDYAPPQPQPNTNADMYATNNLYRMLCVYCNSSEKFLVNHYMKQHPEHEVPIARLSPNMADRLRKQAEEFKLNMRKIQAHCLFCEEDKKMTKNHWTQHFLMHTGELKFSCDTCDMKFKNKSEHKNCDGNVVNVFDKNSLDASLMGYICNDCNFVQFHLPAMHKHLVNGHHYLVQEQHYQKLIFIPDMSPVQSALSSKYRFAEASERFKCTLCLKQLPDAETFTEHIATMHKEIDQYDCFCGETITKLPEFNKEWVAAHLMMHRTDLHQCMICMGVYLRKTDVRTHILKRHRDRVLSYQHICRKSLDDIEKSDYHTKISESTIQQLQCNICQHKTDGILAHALNHFKKEHPAERIQITGIVAKKITNLLRIHNNTETTYKSGLLFNIQLMTNFF